MTEWYQPPLEPAFEHFFTICFSVFIAMCGNIYIDFPVRFYVVLVFTVAIVLVVLYLVIRAHCQPTFRSDKPVNSFLCALSTVTVILATNDKWVGVVFLVASFVMSLTMFILKALRYMPSAGPGPTEIAIRS